MDSTPSLTAAEQTAAEQTAAEQTAAEPIVPTGAEHRRGPFKPGDQVQLTDAKGRMSTITLAGGQAVPHAQGLLRRTTS